MPAILTDDDYPAIRAALDLSIDDVDLPDETIALPLYAPSADRWVLDRLPTATHDQPQARNAAVYYCAFLIAPSMPAITGEQDYRLGYSRKAVDWLERQGNLLARAEAEISALSIEDDELGPPRVLRMARGDRGR